MTLASATKQQQWFDVDRGLVDRRIYTDEAVYRLELERIFARAWNFVCHESQLKEAGSFFTSFIGEDEVIAVRDREGEIHVLLNSCPHRGNTVCRAELGRVNNFVCSYHGWNFGLDGKLIGMPGEKDYYRGEIDKEKWGLGKAAQVSSYKGFVFATLDPDAPPLHDYLGWVGRLGIDIATCRGEIECVEGVQKNRMDCNWKLAVDNLYDWYHPKVSHNTAYLLDLLSDEDISGDRQMVMLGEYGHGIGGPTISAAQLEDLKVRVQDPDFRPSEWYDTQLLHRLDEAVHEEMGAVGVRSLGHPNIFPNLWIALAGHQVCLRVPRGPLQTDLWWFTFVPKDASESLRRSILYNAIHYFGPAGLLEQDDGENWRQATLAARGEVTSRRPLHFAMGKGLDEVRADPSGQSRIETVVNEHGQRWTYQCWQEYLRAESWQELEEIHSQPPEGLI